MTDWWRRLQTRWMTCLVVVIMLASSITWYLSRDTLPEQIILATGEPGGMYHQIGLELKQYLEPELGIEVKVLPTQGSDTNLESILNHEVDLSLMKSELIRDKRLATISPLHPEFLYVIARKSSHILSLKDLKGRRVAMGNLGTGFRSSALKLFRYFNLQESDLLENQKHFRDLIESPDLDAAVMISGVEHSELRQVMATNQFELLEVLDSQAISILDSHYSHAILPRGILHGDPSIPTHDLKTVASTAYLVALQDTSPKLLKAALKALHESPIRQTLPTLIRKNEVPEWSPLQLHPIAQLYFYPEDNLGFFANVFESIAAIKELFVALCAMAYLVWQRWTKYQQRHEHEQLSHMKDRLDQFLNQTLVIEQNQMSETDPVRLKHMLDSITQIKMDALKEFTDERLRSDQSFSIFLIQCSNLITSIQMNISQQLRG